MNGEDPEAGDQEGHVTTRKASQSTKTTRNTSTGRTSSGSKTGGTFSDKNRAFDLAKQLNGGNMDWKWLTDRAVEALDRPIAKVVQDVAENEWKQVADYLEQYGSPNGSDQGEINFDDLPEDL
ncbi:hypothetical protein GNF85_23675, partial [Clostridium perfringens]